jgi:hypothetical protein
MLWLMAGPGQAQTVIWSDGFESNGASRWQANGPWKIGSPTAGPVDNSQGYRTHTGANCASTQGYLYNKDVRLVCINYNGASSLAVPTNGARCLRF